MTDNRKRYPTKLFWIVILGIVLYIILDAVAQVMPPHYNPISQAESDLAVGSFGYIMTVNFLNRGVLSLLFVFAFLRTVDYIEIPRSNFKAGTILLGIWGLGALLLAVFPTDVPAAPVSWHGAIHLVVAIVAFIGGAFGTLLISRDLLQSSALNGLKRIAYPLSVVVMICWVVEFALPFVLPHLNMQIGGLTERVFLGSVLFWIG